MSHHGWLAFDWFMKTKTITFNKDGYDGFIDFIKAYSILCVLFAHTFPYLDKVAYSAWAGMQVPLFLMVQIFHGLKKEKAVLSICKVLKRVVVPFFIVQIITFFLALLFGVYDRDLMIDKLIKGGGYGPGSYYPWLYLQVALLLPLFGLFLKKYEKKFH